MLTAPRNAYDTAETDTPAAFATPTAAAFETAADRDRRDELAVKEFGFALHRHGTRRGSGGEGRTGAARTAAAAGDEQAGDQKKRGRGQSGE